MAAILVVGKGCTEHVQEGSGRERGMGFRGHEVVSESGFVGLMIRGTIWDS